MITCNIMGPSKIEGHYMAGLGNQMFTVATTIAMAIDNKDIPIFPDLNNKSWYGNYTDNVFSKLKLGVSKGFVKNTYNEKSWKYSKIDYKENMCLNGYFQSHKYFEHRRDMILKIFQPTKEINGYINQKYKNFLEMENTVAVHVRRGDYLTPTLSQYHHTQDKDYYRRAMKEFPEDYNFVFFSDDIEWCKVNFKEKNFYFVEGEQDFIDLYMMSKMKNNIIANSTFSWWGAWLNKNENKKVIMPTKWYGLKNIEKEDHDMYVDGWIKL
tara:strand:+ start:869 stop:1672 length:804 start_codon:yes stop_codon:yes gene_type:complete